MISFRVRMIPTAKGRPRAAVVIGHARIYTPSQTERAELDFIALAAPHAPASGPLEGPLCVALTFWLPVPRSRSRKWQAAALEGVERPAGRPDLDNLAKLVLDALNRSGAFWRDDAQVVSLRAAKYYGDRPGTCVRIWQASEGREEYDRLLGRD